MQAKRPVRKPAIQRGCECCIHRNGDFFNDPVDEKIIRIYCRARHANVDAEGMSKDCDFWELSPNYKRPEKENRYGL